MRVKYRSIVGLLLGIAVVSLALTAWLRPRATQTTTDGLSVVASFYPMYTAALQVVGDTDGVTVTCLTQPTGGCMHDYQLSPAEMAVLTEADVLVMNGAGAEAFLQQALANVPALIRVDTSAGLAVEADDCDGESHEHHHHGNEHLWMSTERYARQIQTLRDELCRIDPAHRDQYRRNADAYLTSIAQVQQEIETLKTKRSFDTAVLFHDSMTYLAEELELTVVGQLSAGEEAGSSAAELTATAEAIRGQAVLFLYDEQYPVVNQQLAAYAGRAATVVLDSAVNRKDGVEPREAWLSAMRQNVKVLSEVIA